MKSITLRPALLLFILINFFACKKDSADPLKSKIIGLWRAEHYSVKSFDKSGRLINEIGLETDGKNFRKFNADGSMESSIIGVKTQSYVVLSEDRFEMIQDGMVMPCRVETISKDKFVFSIIGFLDGQGDHDEFTQYMIR